MPPQDIRVPSAVNGDELLRGSVVEISPTDLSLDGSVLAADATLGDRLLSLKRNFPLLHPGERFEGRLLVRADRDVPWSRLRKVLATAETRDYRVIDFVVAR